MKCIDIHVINSRQQQRAPIRAAGEDRAGGAGLATWHLSAEWGPNTLALCVNKFEQANKSKAMHTTYKLQTLQLQLCIQSHHPLCCVP